MLKLNSDKTELLVIGPKHKVNPPIKGIHVAGAYTEVSKKIKLSSKNLLVTPKFDLKFYGDRSFQVAAPRLWNSLTDDIRSILACKNIRFSALFAADGEERGETDVSAG